MKEFNLLFNSFLGGGDGGGEPSPPGEYSFSSLLGEDGNFKENFTRDLPEELQQHYKSLGNYKSPEAMMKALVETKALVGKKAEGITWPEKDADEATVKAFREKMGIPETYDLQKPEELPEAIKDLWSESDTAMLQDFGQVAHELNLRPDQVEGLMQFQIEQMEKGHATAGAEAEAAEKAYLDGQFKQFSSMYGNDSRKVLNETFSSMQNLLTNADVMGGKAMTEEAAVEMLNNSPGFKDANVIHALASVLTGSGQAKFIEGKASDASQMDAIEDRIKDAYDPTTVLGGKVKGRDPQALKELKGLLHKKAEMQKRYKS